MSTHAHCLELQGNAIHKLKVGKVRNNDKSINTADIKTNHFKN